MSADISTDARMIFEQMLREWIVAQTWSYDPWVRDSASSLRLLTQWLALRTSLKLPGGENTVLKRYDVSGQVSTGTVSEVIKAYIGGLGAYQKTNGGISYDSRLDYGSAELDLSSDVALAIAASEQMKYSVSATLKNGLIGYLQQQLESGKP